MTLELQILALAGLLWAGQLLCLSVAANLKLDPRWLMGPRDEPRRIDGVTGRLQRALSNMTESLLLFAVAVTVLELGNRSGEALTEGCALAYLIARLAYVPAYALGLSPWRSAIWFVGFLATLFMLIFGLFG
ncbi:MAPEG family protein [Algihabitans albus]|uniref:MAPEG family protein n=1 Tax=Algihabitans albus TaxID=2164067 RepID=UPI000E5D4C0A|nr:MAPEG family protein [Algihabitans albus]